MSNISIWNYSIPCAWLSQTELDYLRNLPQTLPTVEWVWQEMDRIWQEFNLDNEQLLSTQLVGEFYSHPVWIMNGIFTAIDSVSASHREAIARYIANKQACSIADYGGGFGQLARAIVRFSANANISIIEPYPSHVGLESLRDEPNVKVVPELLLNEYDVIVTQDVLEHVEDPIMLAFNIASAVKMGGMVIFANCFYPVIQCHLPRTFHLRHTFPIVMSALGLRYIGTVDGASHAQVFIKTGDLSLTKARIAERISRQLGPSLNLMRAMLSRLKRMVI